MCGRFALITPEEVLATQFALPLPDEFLSHPAPPRYNIAPTQPITAVRLSPQTGQREWARLRWGLIPSWAKDDKMGGRMINARSETAAQKPSFRSAFKRRRCLIPADGFYEWQKLNGKKQPIYFQATDKRPFALAGLWESWQGIETCTILTVSPNTLVAPIHNRMPVIIAPQDNKMWLKRENDADNRLYLLRPFVPEKMTAHPVDTFVNNARNDGARCIEPV